MIIHVESHKCTNIVCLPPPHKAGSEHVSSAFVTLFIHKCNRKLFSQTIMCSAIIVCPPKYNEIYSQEPPCSVCSGRATFQKV